MSCHIASREVKDQCVQVFFTLSTVLQYIKCSLWTSLCLNNSAFSFSVFMFDNMPRSKLWQNTWCTFISQVSKQPHKQNIMNDHYYLEEPVICLQFQQHIRTKPMLCSRLFVVHTVLKKKMVVLVVFYQNIKNLHRIWNNFSMSSSPDKWEKTTVVL